MPVNRIGAALAWWMLSTARIIALEGTQPTLTHVPPMVPAPMTATWAPCSAAVMAAENPADPPPKTTRSYFLSGARSAGSPPLFDRKSDEWGKSVSVRLDLGGQRINKK